MQMSFLTEMKNVLQKNEMWAVEVSYNITAFIKNSIFTFVLCTYVEE